MTRTGQTYRMSAVAVVMTLLTACMGDEHVAPVSERPMAVSFDSYLRQSRQQGTTRADGDVHPTGTESLLTTGTAGVLMTDAMLRQTGFGVFASYTGNADYVREGENKSAMNFMFNQRVTWDNDKQEWTYTPLKYWPNDNNPADDQENDTGQNPATGSQEHSYLHFFAYAPFYDYKVHAADYPGTDDHLVQQDDFGLTDMPSNESDFYMIYRSQLKPGKDVDVLWAKQDYMYKTKDTGEGYTTGRVPFVFQHALSRLNLTVMGVFDHVDTSDAPWDGYGDDVADSTRIQVEEVEIYGTCIPDRGRWYLDPKTAPDNGSYNRNATSAYWESFTYGGTTLNYNSTDGFNTIVKRTDLTLASNNNDADVARAALQELPRGVDKTERNLFEDTKAQPLHLMFPPNDHPLGKMEPLKVRVKYRVITYDPRLTLNTPKYFSIVTNDVTAEFSGIITFEPNKTYKLRLLLGLTSVKFEVVDVTDYDVPITLGAVVKEWHTETHEYDVEN